MTGRPTCPSCGYDTLNGRIGRYAIEGRISLDEIKLCDKCAGDLRRGGYLTTYIGEIKETPVRSNDPCW